MAETLTSLFRVSSYEELKNTSSVRIIVDFEYDPNKKFPRKPWCMDMIFTSKFDTTQATSLRNMFENWYELRYVDIRHFNTKNVKDMSHMFDGCANLRIINFGSSFITPSVEDMSYMFNRCEYLKSIDAKFDTTLVKNMSFMFKGCASLESLNVDTWNTSQVKNMSHMFDYCQRLKFLDLSNFDASNVENMAAMFNTCYSLTKVILMSNTQKCKSMEFMFAGCTNLKSIDLSTVDTRNVKDMSNMFWECVHLQTVIFGDHFDTSNVENVRGMFLNCVSLVGLDLSKFDVKSIGNVEGMLRNCRVGTFVLPQTIDVRNINTRKPFPLEML